MLHAMDLTHQLGEENVCCRQSSPTTGTLPRSAANKSACTRCSLLGERFSSSLIGKRLTVKTPRALLNPVGRRACWGCPPAPRALVLSRERQDRAPRSRCPAACHGVQTGHSVWEQGVSRSDPPGTPGHKEMGTEVSCEAMGHGCRVQQPQTWAGMAQNNCRKDTENNKTIRSLQKCQGLLLKKRCCWFMAFN